MDSQENKPKNDSNVTFELERRKVLISASLVSVLILVSVTNQLIKTQNQVDSRSIASLRPDEAELAEWEKQLIRELSREDQERKIASIGRDATTFDQLRFATLEGKYSFRMENGKIKELHFIETPTEDRPKYIPDKIEFLEHYRDAFALKYDSSKKVSLYKDNDKYIETYDLYENDKKSGQVKFTSDEAGRVFSVEFK